MIERIKRLRRGPRRSGNTALLRRYEFARNWRLRRAPLPFSSLSFCLLRRPRLLVKVDAPPARLNKQLTVQNSVRLFTWRHNFGFTIFLSRFERNPEIRYVPVRLLTRPATPEESTATLTSSLLHVSQVLPSGQHAIVSGRRNDKRFHAEMQRKSISFFTLFAPLRESAIISQLRTLRTSILPSLRQPLQSMPPKRTNWSKPGPVTTKLAGTTVRLMEHSAAGTPAPRQEATTHSLREMKTFSLTRRESAVREILPGTMAPPPSMSIASTYRPINIELVSRQVSTRSSAAPTIDSLKRTGVVSGNRPEVTSRSESVEKEINEKIHQQVERTVREQVERTFRSDRVLVQRLSREIQSDLYRGIVFERERLGLR